MTDKVKLWLDGLPVLCAPFDSPSALEKAEEPAPARSYRYDEQKAVRTEYWARVLESGTARRLERSARWACLEIEAAVEGGYYLDD